MTSEQPEKYVYCENKNKVQTKIEMTKRRAARWVKNNYSPYESVSQTLNELGWRSLESRRNDARLIMLFKIIHGYVAIQVPPYFERPQRYTRHMHPLSFRQITYYCHLLLTVILPCIHSSLEQTSLWSCPIEEILTPFGKESVRPIISPLNPIHCFYSTFKLHLFCTNTMSFYHVSLLHFLPPTIFLLPLHWQRNCT